MLQICPNLHGQKFEDPPFEEEILAFIRQLGYPRDIKSLSDVKVSKKNKDMYYPRFTKVIINHFMSKDQSIPRINEVDWHMANNDPILTTMRFIPKHETSQKYGDILPDTLTNQAMKDSNAYKTYHDFATRKVIPKPTYIRRLTREKTDQAPTAFLGKRHKATTKVAKLGKKKQPAQGLETLSKITLSKAEQLKIVTKRSKTQFHVSHTSGSGANEGTGALLEVPDVPTYGSEGEQISWKSSDEDGDNEVSLSQDDDDNADNEDDDGQDEDNEQTESDNDGEDFVHPKFSTPDEEERQEEEDKEEEGSDLRGEELDDEETNEEVDVNELYRDVNVNLEGRDTKMTDALLANVQTTHVIEDTHVIITDVTPEVQQQSSSVSSGFISNMLNPNPDTGINYILNLNTKSTSLVDVPVTSNVELPPSSVTTLPPPPTPLVQPQQQTPVPTPTIVPSTSLQNLPTFSFLFKFEDIVKALEDDFSEFKQTNLFTKVISSIPAKTSHAVVANLFELELKKILIDKMKNNKLIDRSVPQKNLYKALVDAYESDKDIFASYGDSVTLKRRRDDEDEDEEPFAGSNRGSKRRRAEKEPESTSAPKEKASKSTGRSKVGSKSHQKSIGKSAQAEEPIHADEDLEEPAYQEFATGFTKDQPVDETTQHPDLFQTPTKPPTPDRDWNKTLATKHGPVQPWISTLAWNEDPRESFNELMDTPIDFSAFVLNRLKVDTLTPELLVGLIFELIKGSCKSLLELEYFLKEVCKETTDQLDWNNPEGQQYPHDLRKPLPLIHNSRGRRVIPFDHFINNDLVYLSVNRESARDVYFKHKILTVTKLKIVEWHNYKHLEWIIVRRDDDKLYTFKEGDYNRLRLQDIKDMLLLLVQGKLRNLNIKERLALGVSLRMFTRSIVIKKRVEDLQLGIESYQKKLNLTKPDTYKSYLK
ncbi:hypothetical protein Tco_0937470 [Tanacetum coccineum]|uniref:Uncharacterized protein n=1 Tax=Tanacetum coccineum TaxID=301880 RepID=A0ABQ5DEC7_9ASTR